MRWIFISITASVMLDYMLSYASGKRQGRIILSLWFYPVGRFGWTCSQDRYAVGICMEHLQADLSPAAAW